MGRQYRWTNGAQIKIDSQAAGEELWRLRQNGSGLSAEEVLEAARDTDSPLHDHFEWDDGAAAKRYRRGQAERLIYSIRFLDEENEEPRRLFINVVTDTGERRHIDVFKIRLNEDLVGQVLEQSLRDLRSWRNRYDDLKTTCAPALDSVGVAEGLILTEIEKRS